MNFWKKYRFHLAIIIIYILGFVVYSVGYFPGIMNPDSASQWQQVQASRFINWHPIWNTFIMWGVSKIYNTPGSMMVFQQMLYTIMLLWVSFNYIKYGVRKSVVLIETLIFSFVPYFGLQTVYLAKDVIFTIGMVLLINGIAFIFLKKENTIRQYLPISFGALLVASQRSNGLMVIVAFAIILIAVYVIRRNNLVLKIAILTLSIAVVVFGATRAVTSVLNIPGSPKSETLSVPIQVIAGNVLHHTVLTESEQKLTKHIVKGNDNLATLYSPNTVDTLKFSGRWDSDYLSRHSTDYWKLALKLLIRNPSVSIVAYYQQIKYLIIPFTTYRSFDGVEKSTFVIPILNYWDGVPIRAMYFISSSQIMKYNLDGVLHPFVLTDKNPNSIQRFINALWEEKLIPSHFSIVMTPPIMLITCLILLVALWNKLKNRLVLLMILPVILYIGTFLIAMPAPVFRYVWILFFMPIYLFNLLIMNDSRKI